MVDRTSKAPSLPKATTDSFTRERTFPRGVPHRVTAVRWTAQVRTQGATLIARTPVACVWSPYSCVYDLRRDRARFVQIVESEIASLHEGNVARYRVWPSEFAEWRRAWLST